MADPDHLTRHFGGKLRRMNETTRKTGYETGLSICGSPEEGSEHAKQPVLGTINETGGSVCEVGTDERVQIHTHNEHPPSKRDLRQLASDQHDHCVLIGGVEGRDKEIVEDKKGAMLLCMEGDNFNPDDADPIWDKGEHTIDTEDIETMENAGITVKARNF